MKPTHSDFIQGTGMIMTSSQTAAEELEENTLSVLLI